jgi:hypothetical protein
LTEIVMLTLPEDLALLYAAPVRSEITARLRKLLQVGRQPARVLAAASLIELVLAGRVTVESRRQRLLRTDVVLVTNGAATGDAHLDEVLRRIAESDERSCAYWISKLSKASRDVYDDRLVARSLVGPATTPGDGPVADAEAVRAVRDRLRAVLAHSQAVEPREVALVMLLAHTGHLSILLDDPEWIARGAVEAAKATRRDERLGRDAADVYGDLADFGAIVRIATAAAPDGGG